MTRADAGGARERRERLLIPVWVLVLGALLTVGGGALWIRQVMPGTLGGATQEAPRLKMGAPRWTGTPAAIATPEPELRSGCTWLLRVPELGALSDKGMMDNAGFLDASPLEVLHGGDLLDVHRRTDACDDSAAHTPLGMAVRVSGDVHASSWTLRWSSATEVVGNRGPKGRQPLWYVVPGMTLEIPIEGTWDTAWGAPVVSLAAVATKSAHAATMTWGERAIDIPGGGGPVQVRLEGDPSGRALVIRVPDDGPALAIHDLVFGEGALASLVLGTVEGASTPAGRPADAVNDGGPKVTREGVPVRTPIKLGNGGKDCKYVVKLPELEPLSDLRLFEQFDLIAASPLAVWEGDNLLSPHDRGNGCTGGFAHAPNGLVVRPALDPETHGYVLGYDPAAVSVVDGRGGVRTSLWWGLPGTSLTWQWQEPLVPTPHDLTVDMLVVGGAHPAVFHSGDATLQVAPGSGPQRVPLAGPSTNGPWSVTLEVPADGPIVLVRSLEPRAR